MGDKNIIKADFRRDSEHEEELRCSFCGRSSSEVLKMVKGPNANICSECVMIAVQYLVLKDTMPSDESQKILDAFWGEANKGK